MEYLGSVVKHADNDEEGLRDLNRYIPKSFTLVFLRLEDRKQGRPCFFIHCYCLPYTGLFYIGGFAATNSLRTKSDVESIFIRNLVRPVMLYLPCMFTNKAPQANVFFKGLTLLEILKLPTN